jgi:hypothetical protein
MRRGVRVNEKMEIKRQCQESCANNKNTKTPYILSNVLFANVFIKFNTQMVTEYQENFRIRGRMERFHQNYRCENYTSVTVYVKQKNKKGVSAYFYSPSAHRVANRHSFLFRSGSCNSIRI